MRVKVAQIEGIKFEATTHNKQAFVIDPKNKISAQDYFAIGLITCSASDIVLLPENQGKTVSNLTVECDLERTENPPYRFVSIHIIYSFDSDGSDQQAIRWVLSSLESYCTTVNTVRGIAKIYYSVTHNGALISDHDSIYSGETNELGQTAENLNLGACTN